MQMTKGLRFNGRSSQGLLATMLRETAWALATTLLALAVAWHALGFSFLRIDVPAVYVDDAIQYSYIYQANREDGWNQPISRAGAPFGTNSYDFPNADGFNLLLADALGLISDNPFTIFNLYIFATFVFCGLVSYAIFRKLGLSVLWAAVASFVFNLVPFHFQRVVHLFYLMYVSAALAGWLALDVVYEGTGKDRTKRWLAGCAALVCGATGVYYAFFSCIIIATATLCAAAASGTARPLRRGSMAIALLVAMTVFNLAAPLWRSHQEGRNPEVAARQPWQSEAYGLKLTQLLMPRLEYRVPYVAKARADYETSAPLSNENKTVSLGLIGALGFLILLAVPFMGRWNERLPLVLQRASGPTYAGFLYATIGGFGSLFALLITPQLRALNRISPFIAFFAILASVTIISSLLSRYRTRWINGAIALFVIAMCVFDQVAAGGARWQTHYTEITRLFDRDSRFFRGLEERLPAGAMVLQLPLMPYPEEPPKAKLGSYDLSIAYLHTKTLRWTFGAMRGRPEELWQRQIGTFPLAKQISALRTLGFSGIVVDRRGYNDRATAVDGALAQAGLAHVAANEDDIHEFYPLPGIGKAADRALAVAPATGWFDIRAAADGVAISSAGEASLLIDNIGSDKRFCRLELTLETVGIQRMVGLWDGMKKLSEQTLVPGEPKLFAIDLDAAGGKRRIDLRTDTPAVPTGAKPAVAFNWVMSEVPLCR